MTTRWAWQLPILVTVLVLMSSIVVPISGAEDTITPLNGPDVQSGGAIVLDATGNPVIAYRDNGTDKLTILHCGDPTCTTANSIATPDDMPSGASNAIDMVLDASGHPALSYPVSGTVRVLRCATVDCSGANTIETVDSFLGGNVYTSIALNPDGFPVVSYGDNAVGVNDPNTGTGLKLGFCENADCSTVTARVVDPGGSGNAAGQGSSLQLDSSHRPVVSYTEGHVLKVLRCGNAECTADNTIRIPDPEPVNFANTSMVLDDADRPVVSHPGANGLRVTICGDRMCDTGNTTTTPGPGIASSSSLVLDSLGVPVLAYYDVVGRNLLVTRCGDAGCSAGNQTTVVDQSGVTGLGPDITLDASGFPAISYYDSSLDTLKLLRCDDRACAPPPVCNGKAVTINMNEIGVTGQGTAGDDVILGTPGDDVIIADAGDDTVCAGDGNDIVIGGDGDDELFGESGSDLIRGNAGVDLLDGADGADRLLGGVEGDTINGGEGDDYIGGFGGADTINGGPGNETIFGGFGADTIDGGPGMDNIRGLIGDDIIDGGDGNDKVYGDRGNDELLGGNGDDEVFGGNGNDRLTGGDGDDTLGGGRADDSMFGGLGVDTCSGNKHIVGDNAFPDCELIFGVP